MPSSETRLIEVWDEPQTAYPKPDSNFRWQTQEGEVLTLDEMSTWHVFNSLKMIWNHIVPQPCRFIPYKPYAAKYFRTRGKWKWAVSNLYMELIARPDKTPTMDNVLKQMARYVIQSRNKCIKERIF